MSYMTAIETMPSDLQMPMLRLLDAFQHDMREQLAVRREDFDKLQSTVYALSVAQQQGEVRLTRLEMAVVDLTEAQQRSEVRLTRLEIAVAELAEAQQRSEVRLTRLEIAVAELAEAQRKSEGRLTRLETAVIELTEAQQRTEHRVEELAQAQARTEHRVEELAQAQARTEQRVEELAAAQGRTEVILQKVIERQDAMGDQLGRVLGRQLETYYRDRAYAYFGRLLRKIQVVSLQDLEEEGEAKLDPREWEDVTLLDLVIRGQATQHPQRPNVLLAFEISAVVDRGDVERAVRRAQLLRKVGQRVVPGVAGEDITQGGHQAAQEAHVLVVQDGHKEFWDEALAAALAA